MKLEHIAKLKKLSPYLKNLVSLSEREVPNVPECILVGYVDDLIVFAEEQMNVHLTLQYSDLSHLTQVIVGFCVYQKRTEQVSSISEAGVLMTKVLAAYFYLLAANCHGDKISSYVLSSVQRKAVPVTTFSSGFTFCVGKDSSVNFYDICRQSLHITSTESGTKVLVMHPELLIAAYYEATGIDLHTHGFDMSLHIAG